MTKKFLTNITNPQAKMMLIAHEGLPVSSIMNCGTQANIVHVEGTPLAESNAMYKKWLDGKYIGLPAATARYTTEELMGAGMVGLYVETEDENVSNL